MAEAERAEETVPAETVPVQAPEADQAPDWGVADQD